MILRPFQQYFSHYQDDGRHCVQWNSFTIEIIPPIAGLELGTAISVGQHLIYRVTGAPKEEK